MSDKVALSRGAAEKLKTMYQAWTRQPGHAVGEPEPAAYDPDETVWARLTEEGEDDLEGRWAWEEVFLDHAGDWQTKASARSGQPDENPAIKANGFDAASGDVVLLRRAPMKGDPEGDTPQEWDSAWAFEAPLPPGLYEVALTQVGGSEGPPADWTYDVVLDGDTLASAQPPAWRAFPGRADAASAGIARVNADGTAALLIAFETPGSVPCAEGEA